MQTEVANIRRQSEMKQEPKSFVSLSNTSSNKKKRCYHSDSYDGCEHATKIDVANKKRRYEFEFYDGCKKVKKGDEQSWDELRELLDEYKSYRKLLREAVCSQGSAATDHGRTSLHILLEKNPPADIISTLIRYSPDALRKKNRSGELPIHTASKNGASLEVLNVLIQAYPEGLEVQNDHGFLPLHDLCFHGATYEALVMLLQAYPEGVKVKDYENCLPIHRACRWFMNLDALDALVDAYPESIGEKSIHGKPSTILNKYCRKNLIYKDQYGRTLLHYAFNGHFSAAVARLLTDANPKGLEEEDCLGNVPASYGAQHKKMSEEEILKSYSLRAIYNEENINLLTNRVVKASEKEVSAAEGRTQNIQKVTTDSNNSLNAPTLANQSEKNVGTIDISTLSNITNTTLGLNADATKTQRGAEGHTQIFHKVTTNSKISEKALGGNTADISTLSNIAKITSSLNADATKTQRGAEGQTQNFHKVTTNSNISEKALGGNTADISTLSNIAKTTSGLDAVRAPIKGVTVLSSRKDATTGTENTEADLGCKVFRGKTLHGAISSNDSLDSTFSKLKRMEAKSVSNEEAPIDAKSTKSREDNYLLESAQVREITKMHKSQMILLKSKFFELNDQFAEMKSNVEQLQSDNVTLRGEVSSMKKEIQELRLNNSDLKSSNKTLMVEMSSVKKDMGELQYLRENVFYELKSLVEEMKSDWSEIKTIWRRMEKRSISKA